MKKHNVKGSFSELKKAKPASEATVEVGNDVSIGGTMRRRRREMKRRRTKGREQVRVQKVSPSRQDGDQTVQMARQGPQA
jgi:hypothetical protein